MAKKVQILSILYFQRDKKNRKLGGIQRYKCFNCNSYFSSKRRPKKLQEIIFKKYIYKRRTLSGLAEVFIYLNLYIASILQSHLAYLTHH